VIVVVLLDVGMLALISLMMDPRHGDGDPPTYWDAATAFLTMLAIPGALIGALAAVYALLYGMVLVLKVATAVRRRYAQHRRLLVREHG
jgi:phosphatidylglycerophosphate synthase